MAPDTNVLVTGGAGFIGSHIVDALLERPSTTVTVLDRLSTGGSRSNLEAHYPEGPPISAYGYGDTSDAQSGSEAASATRTAAAAMASGPPMNMKAGVSLAFGK